MDAHRRRRRTCLWGTPDLVYGDDPARRAGAPCGVRQVFVVRHRWLQLRPGGWLSRTFWEKAEPHRCTGHGESGSDLWRRPGRVCYIHSGCAPHTRRAQLPVITRARHGEANTATRPAFLSSLGQRCHRRRSSRWLDLSPARDSALEVHRRGCGRHARNPLLLLRSSRPLSTLAAYHRGEGYPKLARGAEISTAARSIAGEACRALQPTISLFGGWRF
jgi:hypothetical protein